MFSETAFFLASIPSPHTGVVHLGPLQLHMYGLTLLVAILACIWLTGKRWTAMGGEWELVTRVAVWGVAFGVLGARLYHDITSWSEVPSPKWQGMWEVWKGGLGVWGGIFLGALAGSVIVRRAGANVGAFLDAAAPGLLLAQGIGRIGNWWNQELYGKPTTLPWGLKIDPEHRTVAYFNHATFHPTFLYELIWDVVGVLVLLWIARRFTIRPPGLFALYIAWYCFGRFFEELLRIDPAHHIAGLRLNAWVSAILFFASLVYFILHRRRARGRAPKEPKREPRKKGPTMAIPRGRVR
ncbi:MAG: prolipoprotein diacylglyceryl transferase [Thermoleophilia bacterium]|nr:prolipoprotein diacylglyceryl transferase [Thermoleophilia bacterium]